VSGKRDDSSRGRTLARDGVNGEEMARVATRRRFLRGAFGSGGVLIGGTLLLARRPVRAELGAGEVKLRDLYEKDLSFSALAMSLDGERVAVRGFMAPPLKVESSFFVLTKRPMANCPFCNDASDWPDDIVAVHAKRTVRTVAFNIGIVVKGRLELGDERDPDTGFFSRLRLVDATLERG